MIRRWTVLALAAAALAAPAAVLAPAAHAEPAAEASASTGYRYWSFWTAPATDGAGADWEYATAGPGTLRPAEGSVLGFRFAVSADSGGSDQPRPDPDFAEICGGGPADVADRVALVLDFGTEGDAPPGVRPPAGRSVCAALPDGATAADVLAAEAEPLRYHQSGLLCGIAGYPAEGCGEEATRTAEDSATSPQGSTSPTDAIGPADDGLGGPGALGLWLGLAAVAVVAAAALGRGRRGPSRRRHE